MKVVILAGGFGTRLAEYTDIIPKPMVSIGERPILWHIMRRYAHYGHKDFHIALGYKGDAIKKYFLDNNQVSSDFTIDLGTGKQTHFNRDNVDWRVTLVDTGLETLTGGRVKRLKSFIGKDSFLLTYGDGLADIDLDALLAFHKKNGKMVTVTAVRPSARFGELQIAGNLVHSFQEKPQTESGWINGGYFVVESEFLDLIEGDSTILERGPLESVAELGQLAAYKHHGFWQCMDTKRDRDLLNDMYEQDNPAWECFDNEE
ncbi:MAG: glucose-1-phosphate cytidylyltransferase [Bacteroidota bacterium]|nr:glucose-1-phosphate cytidylyltransferase [Bacteroidota bacterium]